jgi:hypothetical protein
MLQYKNENLRVEAIHRSSAKSEYRARRQFSSHSLSRKKQNPGGVAAAAKIPPEKNDLARESAESGGGIPQR